MHKLKTIHELGQPIIACEAYIVHNGKVLMQKRSQSASKFPGYWIGPGGHVDEGEDVLSAAIREVKEETGVTIREEDIKLKVLALHHHLDRKEVWVEYIYRATIHSKQNLISTPEGKAKWIDIESLKKMRKVFPPSKYYFDHILNDKPGLLYNFSRWKKAELVEVMSERVDKNF